MMPMIRGHAPGGGNGGIAAHNMLDGDVHLDTLIGSAVRGDLIVANATPKFARLAIGPANSVLFSNNVNPAWSTGPTLAAKTTFNLGVQFGLNQGIQDNAAGQRMRFSDGSFGLMNIYLTGLIRIDGTVGIDVDAASAISLKIVPAKSASSWTGVLASPTLTATTDTANVVGFSGIGTLIARSTATGGGGVGLDFQAQLAGGGVGAVVANLISIRTRALVQNFTGTLAELAGMLIRSPFISGGTPVIPTGMGLDIQDPSHSSNTDAYTVRGRGLANGTNRRGFYHPDITGGTIARMIDVEAMMILGSGEYTDAANETPMWLNEGVTPTLRQVKWKDGAAIGAGDKVMVMG